MKTRLLLLLLCLFIFSSARSQKKEEKWDVNDPPGSIAHRDIRFTTDEGTWMSLDVSPDGQTIVFDLLGDIYSIPITGGVAKALRTGLAYEVQPRFSPNGKQILFTTDAGGGDNIWVMDTDGANARQITKESFRLLNNPAWMPDGQYFVARKHFTSSRSLGAGEIWMYHISGGEGIQLTKRKNDQQDVNEPSVSSDGRYVYFSEDMYPGGFFQYNKDPNSQIYVIKRYDREKGEIKDVIDGAGGACRPQISRDGKKLAFVRRIRTQSVLYVQDLETGQAFPLFKGLSKDQQEAWAVFGAYTGFSWTPDDKHIVIWGDGKLWKVDAQTGQATNIPFQAEINTQVAETVRFKNDAFSPQFEVKVIRHAITAPDQSGLVFSALGHLWEMELPGGVPARITSDADFEFEPSFSPDGKSLAYVSWNDQEKGAVWVLDRSSGRKEKITEEKGIYRTPSFSPDGRQLVFRKDDGNGHQGFTFCREPGIYRADLADKAIAFIHAQGEYPVFSADGQRIYYQSGGFLFGSITKSYHSVKPDGSDEKKHLEGKYAQRFVLSPDNDWVAWSELYKVYMAPFPKTGNTIGLSATTKAVPVAQVARDEGINLHWSADSKKLFWTLGNEYFSDSLTERFKFLEGARDSLPPLDTVGIKIPLTATADRPEGMLALTNARIITMEGDEVIENGTVLIEGNSISAVGTSRQIKIPRAAQVVNCNGKTIMPGLIDAHAHVGDFRYGLSPQQNWYYYANLAYGVTTSHDPSSNSEMIFGHSELIKSGLTVGPRLFSTGVILYGADGDFKAVINSLDDARSALRRTKAYGAFSVKSYNQPRREQRQQVLQAAQELGMLVVPEGGSTFFHNMTMVADGHTTVEHNIPVAPLFRDVTEFWSKTEVHNTPTLIVNYAGMSGEYYWYQHSNVWENERLLTFTPRGIVDSRARHRTMIPEEEYQNGHMLTSRSLKKLQDAGVKINLGAHGQLQGLGAHWELWLLQQGGMSNLEALRCATINGARSLGMDHQIGSIKAGKLADLIVLDANPLDNIQNSEKVHYTIINGRIYDSATMNEVGHYNRPRQPFYFEEAGSGNAWPLYYTEGHGMEGGQCSCRR